MLALNVGPLLRIGARLAGPSSPVLDQALVGGLVGGLVGPLEASTRLLGRVCVCCWRYLRTG